MKRTAILGFGSRGVMYATYAKESDGKCEVKYAIDTNPGALEKAQKQFGIPPEHCFSDFSEFLREKRECESVCVCTQDRQHREHALAAMSAGYDILLEKPIAPDPASCAEIAATAKRLGRKVFVSHVLRYTTFFGKIRELVRSGELGEIVNLEQEENVGIVNHYSASFVRGPWQNAGRSAPMILAKCCHDLDLVLFLTGKSCEKISSFGNLFYFNRAHAPEGSTEYCVDCPHQGECIFDAERMYLTERSINNNGWLANYIDPNPTDEKIIRALRTTKFGKCVFRQDNDVVDHQTVNMLLEGGATATLTMNAFADKCHRYTKVSGTRGELYGSMEEEKFHVNIYGKGGYDLDMRDFTQDFSGHGGGDRKLFLDFLDCLDGGRSESASRIERSVESHMMAFAAEESRRKGGMSLDVSEFSRKFI